MGSSNQQTQSTQQSSTQPWAASQPAVNGILGQLNPLIASSAVNPTEAGAISQLTSNAVAGNPYAPQIGANATSLLSGGGATNQAGAVNQNYQNYYNQTSPLASNTNYDPTQTPGIGTQLTALDNSITQQINGQFAGADRFGSGANAYALAQGLAAGEAPVLTAQYNANVANQQGAAANLYGAGNTTANTLSGYNQQALSNQQAGTQAASAALQAQNYGPAAMLAAQQLAQSIPAQNLGLLAQIGIPIAGLGTQSSGNGTSTTTTNPSLLSSLTGVGGLFSAPANGTSAATGMGQAAAGLGSAASSGVAGLLQLLSL